MTSAIHTGRINWLITAIAVLSRHSAAGGSCGGDFVSDEGDISSPNFPSVYDISTRCVYRITVPEGYKILLTFQEFELESTSACDADYIKIYDGDIRNNKLFGRFCGTSEPEPIWTTGNQVTVEFRSDHSVTRKGFLAKFQKNNCVRDFGSDEGNISSPNFPRNYNANEGCLYRITMPTGSRVLLIFQEFELEERGSCGYDYIQVFNGDYQVSGGGNLYGLYCGFSIPGPIWFAGNKVTIVFHSDRSHNYQGFFATFEKVTCGRHYTSEKGTIFPPKDLHVTPFARCIYIITVLEGKVLLSFGEFQFDGKDNCFNDYLKIYDGPSLSSRSLGTFCGVNTPAYILSSGNKVTLDFRSYRSNQNERFLVEYKTVRCGGTFDSEEGIISSPNFPHNYNPNGRCVYIITVPERNIILLTFDVFELETQEHCKSDSIKIYDGNSSIPNLGTFCGFTNPSPLLSSTNKVTIDFRSDDRNQYKGFSVKYSAEISCQEDTCKNSGFCARNALDRVVRCSCIHGYKGRTCEEKILCANTPCKNGGICTQDGTDGVFRCTCQSEYYGPVCEEIITFHSMHYIGVLGICGTVIGTIACMLAVMNIIVTTRSIPIMPRHTIPQCDAVEIQNVYETPCASRKCQTNVDDL